jgi:hypothetical protein
MIQFRGFAPPERDRRVQALGPAITVQESPWECSNPLAVNHERKPFDDRPSRSSGTGSSPTALAGTTRWIRYGSPSRARPKWLDGSTRET